MKVVIGDLLTVENEDYITLEVIDYEGCKYAFVNKIVDEEPTDEFYIFNIIEDNVIIVEDDKLRHTLIVMFQKLLEQDINKILEN